MGEAARFVKGGGRGGAMRPREDCPRRGRRNGDYSTPGTPNGRPFWYMDFAPA